MKECTICHSCFSDDINHCPFHGHENIQSLAGDPVLDGRYQLERRLGQGGMGIVYKAHHVFLKTAHAIKVILPELVGNDPTLATRFRQEAMAAAAIRHPNIISVTDYGVIKGIMPFLVMEFVQGQSLHDLLEAEGKLSPQRALEFMMAIAAGVSAAHQHGIVHRDLKPLNIMLQDDRPLAEAVKILDFGLAKIKSGELLGSFVLAKTIGMMGSPYYMAPEQWSDEELDQRSDIYSLGIILFQMLAGDVPFKGVSVPTIMKKHLMDPPPHFAELDLDVPPEIEQVVHHALEKDPNKRPATTEEFILELRHAVMTSAATNRASGVERNIDFEGTTRRLRTEQRAAEEAESPYLEETRSSEIEAARYRQAEEARQRAEEEARQQAEAESARLRAEEEERRQAELEQLRLEEEARQRAEAEAAQKRAAEEEARRRAEAEERLRAEEEARQRVEEERQRAEEAARLAAEAEARRKAGEEARLRAEEEAKQRAAEEERKRAEAEARRLAEAEAARLREAEEQRRREEEQRLAEEARRQAEEESARLRAEEEARLKAEAEARQRAALEAEKRQADEAARLKAVEEARLRAETEAKRKALEEAERIRAAEERRRVQAEAARKREEEEARRKAVEEERLRAEAFHRQAEEERRRQEAEAQQRAEEARRATEEAARQHAAEEARRRAEADRFDVTVASDATIELAPSHPLIEETQRYEGIKQKTTVSESDAKTAPDNLEQTRLGGVVNLPPPAMHPMDATQQSPSNTISQQTANTVPESQKPWQQFTPLAQTPTSTSDLPAPKKPFPRIYIGAALLVLLLGSAGVYLMTRQTTDSKPPESPQQQSPQTTATGEKAPPGGGSTSTSTVPAREMVLITGGTFQMGRNDGPRQEGPAHTVTVETFYIDKTEVTNAQYAECVQALACTAPPGKEASYWKPWVDDKPPAGQEQWPVRNVSAADAETYARWLSKRDHAKYRLPTEEEWEYVARDGGLFKLYPWGNKWANDRANIDTPLPKQVGSYPQGATSTGVLDLIGNVWEWTSSKASYYQGNTTKVVKEQQEEIIHRGGSYLDKMNEITATSRDWHSQIYKDPIIGFRLVRESP